MSHDDKALSACDKVNVPYHIVDDVIDLLRENNISIQPEPLRKRAHFQKIGQSIQKSIP